MSCCGHKRDLLRAKQTWATASAPAKLSVARQASPQKTAPTIGTAGSHPLVTLRYTESSSIVVRGFITGSQYRFSAATPLQSVDRRDTNALLRTRLFVRERQ
jgi:hypothetical protein